MIPSVKRNEVKISEMRCYFSPHFKAVTPPTIHNRLKKIKIYPKWRLSNCFPSSCFLFFFCLDLCIFRTNWKTHSANFPLGFGRRNSSDIDSTEIPSTPVKFFKGVEEGSPSKHTRLDIWEKKSEWISEWWDPRIHKGCLHWCYWCYLQQQQ